MQIRLRPHNKNIFPLSAFLIKGENPKMWVKDIMQTGWDLSTVDVHPIGGRTANSVWGCIVISGREIDRNEVEKFELCQKVNDVLYIPEMSRVVPAIDVQESMKIFNNEVHLFHPECGLVPLGSPIEWSDLLLESELKNVDVKSPSPSIFISEQIIGFHIQPVPKEDILKDLESPVVPEKMKEEPLSVTEKAKLKMYKALLAKENGTGNKGGGTAGGGFSGAFGGGGGLSGGLGGFLGGFAGALAGGIGNMFSGLDGLTDSMRKDMEELERRNKSQIDKLMDMLNDNPEEALKYAIPLDEKGTSRGGDLGEFNMTRMWDNFSLFGQSTSSGLNGPGVNLADYYIKLRKQYRETAEKMVNEKKYEKAAFIYMKLLQDYRKAAETLEQGKLYQEAAAIYLKYVKDKVKAAECYEKGLFYKEAIELYKEEKKYEKAGDLLMKIKDRKGAFEQYTLLAKDYESKYQYVKASLVYRNKMDDRLSGQKTLLRGWEEQRDGFNCLNNYFNNIPDEGEALRAMQEVRQNGLKKSNCRLFLKVIGIEFVKRQEINKQIKEMGYELISKWSIGNPDIVHSLKLFDKDPEIVTDVNRYTIAQNLRKRGMDSLIQQLKK
ncbi:MAG: hypothetical protein P1U56_07035 [Saprospiraceae bacterium]|nr:hypothetical protein [Saprospiraceae bacterium]